MAKKHRLPTQLIEIENGTKRYMPLEHALRAVDEERAIIANGKVRFLRAAGDSAGYSDDTGTAQFAWSGKSSGGFTVLQATKRYAPGYVQTP